MAKSARLRPILRRLFGLLVAVAVVVLIVLASLPQPVSVDVAEVARGPLEVTVHEDGRTQVKDRYTISAPLTGNVARITWHPGDLVEEGTPVAFVLPVTPALLDARSRAEAGARLAAAQANHRRATAAVSRAQVALEQALREEERSERLLRQGGVSEQTHQQTVFQRRAAEEEVASARFGARVAAYEVQMAEAALGRVRGDASADAQLSISSPIAGRVLRVLQRSEGVVQAGTPLLEVGDPRALEVVVDVLSTEAVMVEPGDAAHIVQWGGSGALTARVRLKEPSAFTRTSALGVDEQRVNVVLDLTAPEEEWAALGDGYRVEAVIIVDRAEDVMSAPASAIFRHGGGWAVFVVRDGVAARVPVEIGRRSDRAVEITSGLEPGARVVLHPSDRVVDATRVAPR